MVSRPTSDDPPLAPEADDLSDVDLDALTEREQRVAQATARAILDGQSGDLGAGRAAAWRTLSGGGSF
jgi:hypothetical protein